MKKFTFNLGFLDRFKKTKHSQSKDDSEQFSPPSSEYDSEENSDENSDDFKEGTLSGFHINKHQQELADTPDLPEEEKEDIILPETPKASHKFKLNFPKFNRQDATNKIKASLAGKSPLNSLEKVSWNDFVLRLFSPYTRGKVHAVFIILLVVVITYMFGKNIALFINRTPPVVKSTRPLMSIPLEKADTILQDINKISSTNLFNAKDNDKASTTTAKIDIDSIICLDAERPTSLQIKLLDTIVLQDSIKSVASVQVRGSSELQNVREGERLDEMAEVSKINRMKLILKNLQTGDCEYAMTDAEASPLMPHLKIVSAKEGKSLFKSINPNIKNTGNSFRIKRAFRDSMINNMSDILTQAKALQITNPDGSLSFKMTEIVPGSLYSMLDIQNDDVIDSINGKKIENLNDLMGLLGKIKEIDQFQLGSKRNGMPENKEYSFE